MVTPFLASVTLTSLAVPVREPSGSPLARASPAGTGAAATSASVIGFGEDAAGADAGVCVKASGAKQTATRHSASSLLVMIFIFALLLFPNCVLEISPIEHTDNSVQTDGDAEEHNSQPRGIRTQGQTEHAD